MAYVSVESDDKFEEGPEGLQFHSSNVGSGTGSAPVHNTTSSGGNYFQESAAPVAAGGFWTIEYYQPYFDVDTKIVLTRCITTLLPTSPSYLSAHLTPSVDLYGPFWTLSTLVFALFLSSSLASSITTYLSKSPQPTAYDFQLLSVAVGLVYSYGLALPVLFWFVLRYMGVGEWSMAEAVAVWGYGQFVWIPVAVLCVIPVPVVRWVLTGIGFGVSGYFLAANVYPILASAEHKATRGIIVLLGLIHAGVALSFKVLFFSYYITQVGPKDPLPEAPGSGGGGGSTANSTATLSFF